MTTAEKIQGAIDMIDAKAVTDEMMRRMEHAIGLDNKEPKDGVYEAYRNYAVYGDPVEDWELLVAGGYAERMDVGRKVLYHLTDDGFRTVARRKGLLIRYTREYQ